MSSWGQVAKEEELAIQMQTVAKEEELAIQVQPEAGTLAELEGKAEDTGDKDRRLSWRPASKLCLKSSKSQIVWQNRPATENQR